MIIIPSYWVYNNLKSPQNLFLINNYIISIYSSLLLLSMGIFFSNLLYFKNKKSVIFFYEEKVENSYFYSKISAINIIILLYSIIVVFYYLSVVPINPLNELLLNKSTQENLDLYREMSFKLLDPRWGETNISFYFFLFQRTLIFPFFITLSFCTYFFSEKKKDLLIFIIFLLSGIYFASISLARAPVAAIFLRLFIAYLIIQNKKISLLKIILFIILIISYPFFITYFNSLNDVETNYFFSTMEKIFIRLTYTPSLDLYYYYEIFPHHHEFLYGETLLKPFKILLGLDYFYIENYISLYLENKIISAHSNAAFPSNLYADFGYFGVAIGSFFVGFFLKSFDILLSSSKKEPISVTTYACSFYALWVLNFGSITSVIFVNGLLFFIFLSFFIKKVVYGNKAL